MSCYAINEALKINIEPNPKIVLIVLADNAGDDDLCEITLKNLSKRCFLSEKETLKALIDLKTKNILNYKLTECDSIVVRLFNMEMGHYYER